jgi:hypothetical protein
MAMKPSMRYTSFYLDFFQPVELPVQLTDLQDCELQEHGIVSVGMC